MADERRLRRTHCATCGVELNEATGRRKNGRERGWHAECRACAAISRRAKHDEAEAVRRTMVTRDVCDICSQPERARRNGVIKPLALDHDHRTGAWRGVLCQRCNLALGMFSDQPGLLRRAAEYIENPPGLLVLE